MIRHHLILSMVVIPLSFSVSSSQVCEIGAGRIPYGYSFDGDLKKIPIYDVGDQLTAFVVDENDSGTLFFEDPDSDCLWNGLSDSIAGSGLDLEYLGSVSGTAYVYNRQVNSLYFCPADPDSFNVFMEVDCPGRPYIDINSIHVIWEGTGDSLVYGFSVDTLHTFEIEQSFLPPGNFVYFAGFPDRQYKAAVFYDSYVDSIHKFAAGPGEPFYFQGQYESFQAGIDITGVYDITLNSVGGICSILHAPGSFPWGDQYFWSEDTGPVFLRESGGDFQQGTNFEISLDALSSEMIIVYSTLWGATDFYYSTGSGQAWSLSEFEDYSSCYASTTRIFGDTIHLVYYDPDMSPFNTYYRGIPKSEIVPEIGIMDENHGHIDFVSLSNYPNPFNSSTTISFTLPEPARVDLSIYDIRGRLVNTLLKSRIDAGYHSLVWDGTDRFGKQVSSGIYIYTIKVDEYSRSRRMLLLK